MIAHLARGASAAIIAGLAFAIAGTPALARTETLSGHQLVLSANTEKPVTVAIDSALAGQIRVEHDGDDSNCPGSVTNGSLVNVSDNGCDDSSQLRIFVPPHTPLILTQNGNGRVTIGDIGAALTVDSSSDGSVRAGAVTDLVINGNSDGDVQVENVSGSAMIDLKGDGSARIASLNGKLALKCSGDGGVLIGHISSPEAQIVLQGSGDALIGHGMIENLTAQLEGSGDLIASAVVKDAVIQSNGSGDVSLSQITGHLTKNINGSGDVHIGGNDIESALATAAGGFVAAVGSDADGSHVIHIDSHHGRHHGDEDGGGSVFTIIVLAIISFFIYRTLKRNNNWPPRLPILGNRNSRPQPAPPATDPGVRGLVDLLTRVESRLVRLENFVTTREFDLHRQFRDLK